MEKVTIDNIDEVIQVLDLYMYLEPFYVKLGINASEIAYAAMILLGRYKDEENDRKWLKDQHKEMIGIARLFKRDIQEMAREWGCENEEEEKEWINEMIKSHPILNEVEQEEAN